MILLHSKLKSSCLPRSVYSWSEFLQAMKRCKHKITTAKHLERVKPIHPLKRRVAEYERECCDRNCELQ